MNKLSAILIFLLASWSFTACSDDTAMVGIDLLPGSDHISTLTASYPLSSRTVKVDEVRAKTGTCYLGSVIDPDMHVRTTSGFLAQFHVPENFSLPSQSLMVKGEDGRIEADSIDVRLYIDTYYGDSLATMKLDVIPLSASHILEEGDTYTTGMDVTPYLDEPSDYRRSISYTIKDLTRPDTETDGSTYYRQIVVRLPKKLGTKLLTDYYASPEHFANSYAFIHHVLPGFYFKSAGGIGSMLTTKMIGLNVYFRYHTLTEVGTDTIVDGFSRFGSTPEVIQTTTIDNSYPGSIALDQFLSGEGTYVKTPAGLLTELTLPVDDIVAGEHRTDSINQAKLTIRRYPSTAALSLPAPTYLLLVRKDKADAFFAEGLLPNNRDAYLSDAFTATSSAYQFANVASLITQLREERDAGAGITPTMGADERNARLAAWELQHPDWNKVQLIPVDATFTTNSDYYGNSTKTLRSVRHFLGLSSAHLEGGDNALNIDVIYSRYNLQP